MITVTARCVASLPSLRISIERINAACNIEDTTDVGYYRFIPSFRRKFMAAWSLRCFVQSVMRLRECTRDVTQLRSCDAADLCLDVGYFLRRSFLRLVTCPWNQVVVQRMTTAAGIAPCRRHRDCIHGIAGTACHFKYAYA